LIGAAGNCVALNNCVAPNEKTTGSVKEPVFVYLRYTLQADRYRRMRASRPTPERTRERPSPLPPGHGSALPQRPVSPTVFAGRRRSP